MKRPLRAHRDVFRGAHDEVDILIVREKRNTASSRWIRLDWWRLVRFFMTLICSSWRILAVLLTATLGQLPQTRDR